MSDVPASPRAKRLTPPRWLDGRLVLGVLLVLVSVVVGSRVLASADRSELVWAAASDLTAGSQLGPGDLVAVRVRLFDSGPSYLRAHGDPPVGYLVRRGIGAGELLPEQALARPEVDVDFRLVTVPVEAGHYPPTLAEDQRVDLWVTPELAGGPPSVDAAPGAAAAVPGAPGSQADGGAPPSGAVAAAPVADPARALALRGAQQVLSQVAVATAPDTDELAAGGSTVPIVLQVRPDDVDEVVSAMGLGRLDVVRVPRAAETAGDLAAPVEAG